MSTIPALEVLASMSNSTSPDLRQLAEYARLKLETIAAHSARGSILLWALCAVIALLLILLLVASASNRGYATRAAGWLRGACRRGVERVREWRARRQQKKQSIEIDDESESWFRRLRRSLSPNRKKVDEEKPDSAMPPDYEMSCRTVVGRELNRPEFGVYVTALPVGV